MRKYFKKYNKEDRGSVSRRQAKASQGGFVLLYVIVISSIILAMTLSVGNIALKEIKFSTSARDTNDAFFAADTGAECALYNDRSDINSFAGESEFIKCLDPSRYIGLTGELTEWHFVLSGLGIEGKSCAKVKVTKYFNDPVITTIISKGYNDNGGYDDGCDQGPNTIERQLEVKYSI